MAADACEVIDAARPGGLVLSCEHASRDLPPGWTWPSEDRWLLNTHWSHDIGAAVLAREAAAATGAPLVMARFSRLLIDPNRPLSSDTLFRRTADDELVHLNRAVDDAERARRIGYWEAYHQQLGAFAAADNARTLFAVHSFTDVYEGAPRGFEIGVLFDRDEALSRRLADELSTFATTRLNEPYSGKAGMIYAANRHARANGLAAVEIEVRQDRILDASFRQKIVAAVAAVLTSCVLMLSSWSAHAAAVYAVDGRGTVVSAKDATASLQRTPPADVPVVVTAPHGDVDALRYLVVGTEAEVPSIVDIASVDERGGVVANLRSVGLTTLPCPPAALTDAPSAPLCAVTDPIRVVADEIDALHPLVRSRSVVGRLGGAVKIVGAGGEVLGTVRIAGPRQLGVQRLRGRLRFVAVRLAPGGAVPLGTSEEGMRATAAAALGRVNALWGACGISFGGEADLALSIVDPPPSHLLAVGCDHGVRASGGELRFRVARAGAKEPGPLLTVPTAPGMGAAAVARRVAHRLRRAGWSVLVTDNPRMMAGAGPTSDVSVRAPGGELARFDPPAAGPVSTDATLGACIGAVNLEDGLLHFTDVDSMVGTVEERTLILAYDDHDVSTIDVLLIPGFARGGRIGESFIGSDGGSARNVVIIDRAGLRSNRASFTLAHELGHVLLDDPGHPDDFGIDMPTRLMDADSADGSAFGPRRLSLAECKRAMSQSGPNARTPILSTWPLAPLLPERSPRRTSWHTKPAFPWLRTFF